MKAKINFIFIIICLTTNAFSQSYPTFGNDIPVTINGLNFDAMEPALSADGNALFFNSLNDGITTSLYYAAKVNDSVFNFIGLVPVVNQTITPRLDAVASLDSANNLYWVSTRNYPASYNNLQRIKFTGTGYTNFGSVYGDFYINSPGHLIMDVTTNFDGNTLIYCNAYFNNCLGGAPCKASMGIAQKLNDSTFNKVVNTSALMANINDTSNYIVYAPSLSKNGLELYFTRLLHGGLQTEIMVSVRTSTNQAFSAPSLLIGAPNMLPEAATISSDNSKIYYHKKIGSTFKLFLRYKTVATDISILEKSETISAFPNPCTNYININNTKPNQEYTLELYNALGELLLHDKNISRIDISSYPPNIYLLKIKQGSSIFIKRILKI